MSLHWQCVAYAMKKAMTASHICSQESEWPPMGTLCFGCVAFEAMSRFLWPAMRTIILENHVKLACGGHQWDDS
jgi:hypothetical protein